MDWYFIEVKFLGKDNSIYIGPFGTEEDVRAFLEKKVMPFSTTSPLILENHIEIRDNRGIDKTVITSDEWEILTTAPSS